MMIFRSVKQSIISILEAGAGVNFIVIKSNRQTSSADELLKKFVKVFYRSGSFPHSASSSYGRPVKHNMVFDIELSVAAKSGIDLSIINDENSTPEQRAAAMTSFDDACLIADDTIDELFENVFQIIMSPLNYDLGFLKYGVADRWISDYRKDDPLPRGEYAVITANFQITCNGEEEISSETGTPALLQDANLTIAGDQKNSGVSGQLGGND